jgi:acyl phosphate:glycerol-3-phosphate acyltransferase
LLNFSLLLIGAYLLGSIPVSYLVVKIWRGEDIRLYGSGQAGSSAVFRQFSRWVGITVGLYDLLKGALVVWIANILDLSLAQQLAVGTAIIVGHNWPVFLKFNAGRGLAATVGVIFFLQYEYDILIWAVIVFGCIAAFTLLLGSSPVTTLLAVASMPVVSAAFGKPLTLTLGITALLLLLIIRRLTAPKTSGTASVSRRRLLFNRFFFDRDIRDGKFWIKRKPADFIGKNHSPGNDKGA